jgi:stage III sporulation protein AA
MEDILTCINTASRYSPWAAGTISQGFLTAPGGHRIGICGEAVIKGGHMAGIRRITSLNIRVARDITGIAEGIPTDGSVLIVGAPGRGKTTLLRDLVRVISNDGGQVSVVDERCELFPGDDFFPGVCTDILSGCGKREGITAVLRSMGPEWIAVDEITDVQDCEALLQAGWCGVKLLATAHADSVEDLKKRDAYRNLLESGLFRTVVVMKPDRRWELERMCL